jgi:hypothetical protein
MAPPTLIAPAMVRDGGTDTRVPTQNFSASDLGTTQYSSTVDVDKVTDQSSSQGSDSWGSRFTLRATRAAALTSCGVVGLTAANMFVPAGMLGPLGASVTSLASATSAACLTAAALNPIMAAAASVATLGLLGGAALMRSGGVEEEAASATADDTEFVVVDQQGLMGPALLEDATTKVAA